MSSISFIVIGRNEGWKLQRCFSSILELIQYHKLSWYEIIYVDSDSEDKSIEVAFSYPEIKVFRITGKYNAAIARNIGAIESLGEALYFIDGDMELEPDFLRNVYIENEGLRYDYCSGHIIDLVYDSSDMLIKTMGHTYKEKLPVKEEYDCKNGGIFLIRKEIWESVNGMSTKYRRSQDLDLAIRLHNKGISLVRLPFIITRHHTIDYLEQNNLWSSLRKGYVLYPALLLRNHITSVPIIRQSLRSNYTAFLLFISILCLFLIPKCPMLVFLFYLLINIIRNYLKNKVKSGKALIIEMVITQFIRDIAFIISFFFFYPIEENLLYVQCTCTNLHGQEPKPNS